METQDHDSQTSSLAAPLTERSKTDPFFVTEVDGSAATESVNESELATKSKKLADLCQRIQRVKRINLKIT